MRDLPSPPKLLAPPECSPTAFYIAGTISSEKSPENRHQVLILLDSGATTSAIDRRTVEKFKLPLIPLPTAIQAINADGTNNSAGYITHACSISLHIGSFTHRWALRVTTLHDADVYLGFDWLHHFNPPINWKDLTLSLSDVETMRRTRNLPALPAGIPLEYAEFAEIFTQESFDKFPPERPWDHEIKFVEDAPKSIAAKIYPLTPNKMKSCREFLDENLTSGRIEPGQSPITSSFFFVKKFDQSLRPVMDYHEINKWTVPDHYPLPLIDQLIMSLTSAMVFTKLDIRWGFNNIRIKPEAQFRAAFLTPFGCFIPLVMFFGLCNSPSTFQ
jgi:Retroviral aspartyl protease